MRIHQILEACVEYAAYDGVLGSDVQTLVNHLHRLDNTIDDEYFAHIFSLLASHTSIELIITRHPIQPDDGPILLGTAPLPPDFDVDSASKASLDVEELINQGVRGRALAFKLAGKDFQSSLEAKLMRREERDVKRAAKSRVKTEAEEDDIVEKGDALVRFIDEDDGGIGEDRVLRSDLRALVNKWGSRLRIRVTDQEMYYRLTGSFEKNPRINPTIFHTLQLAARAREKGISAVEIGAAVGVAQGNVHYLMKVLKSLGICAKVETYIPGGRTNLLIFHKFLEQNPSYRASVGLPPLDTGLQSFAPGDDDPAGQPGDDDDFEDDEETDDLKPVTDWEPNYGPLTEFDLFEGKILKQRILELLDYPMLKNHLLARKNLLSLIGWKGAQGMRQRRALARHIGSLVLEGKIEVLRAGPKHTKCFRATKYNPEFVLTGDELVDEVQESTIARLTEEELVAENAEPFEYQAQTVATIPIEHQVSQAVSASGTVGMTIGDLREKLDNTQKRILERYLERCKDQYVAPHLRENQICTTIDTFGRELRIRAYSAPAYRQVLLDCGVPEGDERLPVVTEEVGRMAPLDNFNLFSDPSEVDSFFEQSSRRTQYARGRPPLEHQAKRGLQSKQEPQSKRKGGDLSDADTVNKKPRKYDNNVQSRGRPRKYIHVVRQDGTVARNILKKVLPHPDLAPIYIYLPSVNKLVPAPWGYSGLGPVPPLDDEAINEGQTPEFIKTFSEKARKRGKVKKVVEEGDESEQGSPSKEASVDPALETSHEGPDGIQSGQVQRTVETEEVEPTTPVSAVAESSKKSKSRKRKGVSPISGQKPISTAVESSPAVSESPTIAVPPKKQRGHGGNDPVAEDEPVPSSAFEPTEVESGPIAVDLQRPAEDTEAHDPSPTPVAPQAPAPRKLLEGTPLVELASNVAPPTPTTSSSDKAAQRMAFALLRRMNEVAQVISDAGGATVLTKLWHLHAEWSKRHAGTDHPFAPPVGAQMDRPVFYRAIKALQNEGKLKETTHVAPSHTGRYVKTQVVYLADIDPEVLKAFNRDLSAKVAQAHYFQGRQVVPQTSENDFTVIRMSTPTSAKGKARHQRFSLMSSQVKSKFPPREYADPGLEPQDRRDALLRDPNVVSTLLGYVFGRMSRAAKLHRALIRVFNESPDSSYFVKSDRRVLSLDLFYNKLTVAEWYAIVSSVKYSEELESYVRDPATRNTELANVPTKFRPPGGYAGARSITKLRSALQVLVELKVISPLAIAKEGEDSLVICTGLVSDEEVSFKVAALQDSLYFRLYEAAPVYHIANEGMGLLGVVSLKTVEQAEAFWKAVQIAGIDPDINAVPRLQHIPADPSSSVPLTESIELRPELVTMLRSRRRWRLEPELLDVQRHALKAFVEWEQTDDGRPRTDEEIQNLSWEYVIPSRVIRDRLEARRAKVQETAENREANAAARAEVRRKKAAEDLQSKLDGVRHASRTAWEEKVKAAAFRSNIAYTSRLVEFLGRYAIQLPNTGGRDNISDKALDEGCAAFIKGSQTHGTQFIRPNVVRARLTSAHTLDPQAPVGEIVARAREVAKKAPPPKPKEPGKQTRRRRHWTEEDDELLLDAEAIIRARSYNLPGKRGRQAMVQLFPDASLGVMLSRIKKAWEQPAELDYFNRLVETWRDVWMVHRDTEDLPDPHPESLTDFDLPAHIDFLRMKIDKSQLRNAARDGTLHHSLHGGPRSGFLRDLPVDVKTLVDDYIWTDVATKESTMEVIWDGLTNVIRMNQLVQIPLVDQPEDSKPVIIGSSQPREENVKSVLKAMVAIPEEEYDFAYNSKLIKMFSSDEVDVATSDLLNNKVMRRDKPRSDGRYYHFQVSWIASTEGAYSEDLFKGAQGLHDVFEEQGGEMEWPIMAKPGQEAALWNMISNNQIELEVDPATFPTLIFLKDHLATRDLTDVDLEFPVTVHRLESSKKGPETRHGDIPSLETVSSASAWNVKSTKDKSFISRAMAVLHDAGENGLTKGQIMSDLQVDGTSLEPLLSALESSKAFWAGYDTARLVHPSFAHRWMVNFNPLVQREDGAHTTDSTKDIWCVPRSWVDVYGRLDSAEWEKAKRNVHGVIISRPGLTERELRSRLVNLLNRLEVNLVLQSLLDSGLITRTPLKEGWSVPPICATDVNEEAGIELRPSETFWT